MTGSTLVEISEEEAARLICESAKREDSHGVVADLNEPLLMASHLKIGDRVEVTPTDTDKVAQEGTLEVLRAKKAVVRFGSEEGFIWVHAPLLGFDVAKP